MGPEKSFENKVKNFLSEQGIYPLGIEKQKITIAPIGYWEKRFANRNTKSGLPDMHICIYGHSIEVELKQQNGKPSDLQIKMCQQIIDSEGIAFILYPSGFETFKRFIHNIIYDEYIEDLPLIVK